MTSILVSWHFLLLKMLLDIGPAIVMLQRYVRVTAQKIWKRGPPSMLENFFDIFSLLFSLTAVVKIPEGIVVGIQIFAWPPN
jgi:hypothetical protein